MQRADPVAGAAMSTLLSPAEFDSSKLEAFLRREIPDLAGPMQLTRISGGQSNPTYFVDFANRALVLRKQPTGSLLPSAHAVDREYRVMDALAESNVPVPAMVLFHAERDVVGTPFYLMEKVEGRVFPEYALPGVEAAERAAMYASMADTMAKLHCVDWAAAGLGDFGKPGNFFARQVARWTKQWHSSKTRENPSLERLIEWLPHHIPEGDETTLCHGDFRMGNLIFHPSEPRVVAVLDWELSTLGHPLADVAFNCMAWRTLPSEYGGLRGLDRTALGIPSETDYLAHYYRIAGRTSHALPFHFAFAMFRFAVIFEGIAARAASGSAAADNAAESGKLGPVFARRALEAIGQDDH